MTKHSTTRTARFSTPESVVKVALFVIALVATSELLAAPPATFEDADLNGDGVLSKSEADTIFQANYP